MEGLFVYASAMPSIWKKVRLEILGPFSATSEGSRYLVFAVDPSTLWMEARAITLCNTMQVARFALSLFARFGRADLNVVGQKADFCAQLSKSLQSLLDLQNELPEGMGQIDGHNPVSHGRHGAEHVYRLTDPPGGVDAGITTGGMALDKDGQVICNAEEELSPVQAALFSHSEPVNPLPKHIAFTRIAKLLKQRTVNYTNLGSDLLTFVSAHPETWDVKLDGYLYFLRTSVAVCNKGYSAFHLALGRNPNPITGRELMVRSLVGAKEVMALFSIEDPTKKPSSGQKQKSLSQPKMSRTKVSQCIVQRAKPDNDATPVGESVVGGQLHHDVDMAALCHPQSTENIQTNPSAEAAICEERDISTEVFNHNKKAARKGKNNRKRKKANLLTVKCPTCPNTYLTCTEELNLHLQCHAQDAAGERIFRCPECAKICKIWLNMVRHMSHHRSISDFRKLPDECYKCKYCAKDFKVPECLREHVAVVHEGKKRFECHICKEKFKVYKTKMRHIDIKHANITYSCDSCSYSTKVRRNLKSHTDGHVKNSNVESSSSVGRQARDETPAIMLLANVSDPSTSRGLPDHQYGSLRSVNFPVQTSGTSQLSLFHQLQLMSSRDAQHSRYNMGDGNLSAGHHHSGPPILYLSSSGNLIPTESFDPATVYPADTLVQMPDVIHYNS